MTVQVRIDAATRERRLRAFALKDAPALIEAVFPVQKVSFEAQRERKAGAGQTSIFQSNNLISDDPQLDSLRRKKGV